MITLKLQIQMKNNKIYYWTNRVHNFWTLKNEEGIDVLRPIKSHFHLPICCLDEPHVLLICPESDFFHKDADQWRDRAWDMMKRNNDHIWQIPTKRPDRISECLPEDWNKGYENVWLGATIQNHSDFHRIKTLSTIPCYRRFMYASPLLEKINVLEVNEDGTRAVDSIEWALLAGAFKLDHQNKRKAYIVDDWFTQTIADLKRFTNTKVYVTRINASNNPFGIKYLNATEQVKFPKECQNWEIPWIEEDDDDEWLKEGERQMEEYYNKKWIS